MYVCICVYTHVCMYVCMYVYVYIHMYACMYVCIYTLYVYIHKAGNTTPLEDFFTQLKNSCSGWNLIYYNTRTYFRTLLFGGVLNLAELENRPIFIKKIVPTNM